MAGLLTHRLGAATPVEYPLSLNVQDGNGETGSLSAWTVAVGTGPFIAANGAYGFNGANHIRLDANSEFSWCYQDLQVPAEARPDGDAGLLELNLHYLLASTSPDIDQYSYVIDFFGASMAYLGTRSMARTDAPNVTTPQVKDETLVVPAGTRTVRLGWQGQRKTGTELSVYLDDIEANLDLSGFRTKTIYACLGDDASGWTVVSGVALSVVSSFDEWGMPGLYPGAVASAHHTREIALGAEDLAAVATGAVTCFVRFFAWNENADDTSRTYVQFLDNANTVLGTLQDHASGISYDRYSQFVTLSAAVPAGTTKLKLGLQWARVDGTALDAQVGRLNVLLRTPV